MNAQKMVKNLCWLTNERLRRGMTRKELATRLNVSERAVKKYEDGFNYPSRDTYNKIASLFGWEIW